MNKRKRARMSIYVSLCLYMEEECITHWGVCVLQNCGFIKKKKSLITVVTSVLEMKM